MSVEDRLANIELEIEKLHEKLNAMANQLIYIGKCVNAWGSV